MTYMLLIVEPVGQRSERSEDEGRALYDVMMKFSADLTSRGLLVDSQSLKNVAQATRVQVRNGKPVHTDGPFAETKEQLLGFYLVDCDDLEQALDVARDLARANPGGAYELRPVGVYYQSQLPADGATAAQ